MADQDYTTGEARATYPGNDTRPKIFITENILDFGATNIDSGDVAEALNLSAPAVVLFAGLEVLTVEGGTATGDLGDDADPNGYLDGVNLNDSAGDVYVSLNSWSENTTNANVVNGGGAQEVFSLLGGKLYESDDTLDLDPQNTLDAAVIRVFAAVFDLEGSG